MAGLAPEEGHGLGGANSCAHHRPGIAVDAARQIDGEGRRAVGIDRLDHVVRLALDGTVEAGAEQGIDDQCRLADRLRVERLYRIFPSPRCGCGVALQAVALAQQDDRNLAAAGGEFGGRDKTVAAIVAAAGDHEDRSLLGKVHRGLGDRLPGAQHQRKTWCARGDGEPVGSLHLG